MCGPNRDWRTVGKDDVLEKLQPGIYGGGIVEEVTLARATYRGIPERFERDTEHRGAIV